VRTLSCKAMRFVEIAETLEQYGMDSNSISVILRRFEQPDETRVMELGKFEIVRLGKMTIGRATYDPGWK
jgi:hypothetical protein